jgi:hypothetical protein
MKLWRLAREYNGTVRTDWDGWHNADTALESWEILGRDMAAGPCRPDGTPTLVEHLRYGDARYWLIPPSEAELELATERLQRAYRGNGQSDDSAIADAGDWYGYQLQRRAFWLATCKSRAQAAEAVTA